MVTAMEVEEVRAAFVSVVEAEERVKLMKTMLRSGVGFPEVEHFFRKQSQHCRVGRHRQERNDFQINCSMKLLLHNINKDSCFASIFSSFS